MIMLDVWIYWTVFSLLITFGAMSLLSFLGQSP